MKVETDVEVTETVCHEDKIAHLQMIQVSLTECQHLRRYIKDLRQPL